MNSDVQLGSRIAIGVFIASALAVVVWSCAGSLDNIDEYRNAVGTVTNNCFGQDPPKFLAAADCSQCHLAKTNGKGAAFDVLSDDIGGRYTGVSGACPSGPIIDPANPKASTLYAYIDDKVDNCTYHQMPPTGSTVSESDKQCLLTWIDGLDGVDNLNLDGGDSDGGDTDGGDSDDGDSSGSSVTLAKLQSDIFQPVCSACHAGSGAPKGLILGANGGLDLATLRANIVNKKSSESALNFITPNDPDKSYLYHKITGDLDATELSCTTSCGNRMPNGGPYLSAALQNEVLLWINAGAP